MICLVHADVSTAHQPSARLLAPARLLNDERLAQAIGAGSEAAFAALFNRYHQQLYRYCRSLTGNDQDAQDALQSTFANALMALRAERRNAPLKPWLYRIAHNESISVLRSRRITVQVPEELGSTELIQDTVEGRERITTLVADLQELPERQRGALVMRELSGLSHEEIARALQVSVGAAKQTILEARKSLLEFQEGREMSCEQVLQLLSDADGRKLRSRKIRAHLRNCPSCEAFATAIPRRRAEMQALWPVLPAAGAAGVLAKLTGAGTGHGGGSGAAGIAAGSAAKGVAASVSIKAVAAAGAAAVATAAAGTVAVLHHHATPSKAAPPTHALSHHFHPVTSVHRISAGSSTGGHANATHARNVTLNGATQHGNHAHGQNAEGNSASPALVGGQGNGQGQGRGHVNNQSPGPNHVRTNGPVNSGGNAAKQLKLTNHQVSGTKHTLHKRVRVRHKATNKLEAGAKVKKTKVGGTGHNASRGSTNTQPTTATVTQASGATIVPGQLGGASGRNSSPTS